MLRNYGKQKSQLLLGALDWGNKNICVTISLNTSKSSRYFDVIYVIPILAVNA